MDNDSEPRAPDRAQRFDALVKELVPKIRLIEPDLTDDEILEAARRMATYRLEDEDGLGPIMKYPV